MAHLLLRLLFAKYLLVQLIVLTNMTEKGMLSQKVFIMLQEGSVQPKEGVQLHDTLHKGECP